MEILSRNVVKIVEGHCFLGFQVGDAAWGTIQDSHLLFAGDTILF